MAAREAHRPGRLGVVVALLGLLVALPSVLRLVTIPDQHTLRSWLIDEPSALPALAVPLESAGVIDDADAFRLPLAASDLAALMRFDRVELTMATFVTQPVLLRAWIAVDGSPCQYTTPPGAALVDNARLAFVRGPGCEGVAGTALTLEARVARDSGRVALWTLEDDSTRSHPLVVPLPDGHRHVVRGMGIADSPDSTLTRADLLAWTWKVPAQTLWWRGLAAAGVLLVGLVLVGAADRRHTLLGSALPGALGAGCLLGALAAGYALVIPPLQAADEPMHVLSYADLVGYAPWRAEAEHLARRTHFERIRHRVDQHYRATDRDREWPEAWTLVVASADVERRSLLTAWWWEGIYGLVKGVPIEDALWRLRVANAVLFGMASGVAVALLALLLPRARSALVGLGLLVAPTLPFYGMFWGDSPVILSASIVLVAAMTPAVLDSPRAWMAGGPLGGAIVLVALSGRRAWPLLVAAGIVLVGRALLGAVTRQSVGQRITYWGGLLGVLLPGLAWAVHLGVFSGGGATLAGRAPTVGRLATGLLDQPWLVVAALLALPLVERVSHRWCAGRPPIPLAWRRVVQAGAVALVGVTVWSWFRPFPTSNGVLVSQVPLGDYVRTVLTSMATPFRTGHFDQMLSTFFWSGFGWVDVVAPEWMVAALCLASAMMVALWWWSAGHDHEGRQAFLVTVVVAAMAAALVAAAVGTYALNYELYGRFLLGWYLLLLLPAWSRAAATALPWWGWYACPLAVHAFCLQLILLRYF